MDCKSRKILKDYYLSGKSVLECSKYFGLSAPTIYKHLQRTNIKYRKYTLELKGLADYYEKSNSNISKCADHYSCTCNTIRRRLMLLGISINHRRGISNRHSLDGLAEAYLSGKTTIEMATFYGCHTSTILSRLRKLGLR